MGYNRILGFRLSPTVLEESRAFGNGGLDLGRIEGDNLVQRCPIEECFNYTVLFVDQPFRQSLYNVMELAHINGSQPSAVSSRRRAGRLRAGFRLSIILGSPDNKHRFWRYLVALEFNAGCKDGFRSQLQGSLGAGWGTLREGYD